ncbi:MAG: molecular chaperone [Propioniciclava sp.]
MITPDDHEALAGAFGVLGRLHRRAPNAEELDTLRSLADEWPLADTADARRGIAAWLASAAARETTEAVTADHNRLYGVTAKALVAPYESVHRGDDGLVFDEQTLQIRQAYRQLGLQAPHLGREPDDHVGLEFDFLSQAFLRAAEAEDPAPVLGVVSTFLADHILAWVPGLLTRVVEHAQTQFMVGVALLSRGACVSAEEMLQPQ